VTFAAVEPGQYEITARSIDGITGLWSTAEAVRVVGVSLPPGGYAAGGDIFIGRGQDVRFSHTDGLEMTYEAKVAIGPSRAVGPKDPIAIVVELKARGDQGVPEWLELKPEVKLGIEPIDVAFTREGNRLVGTVPPTDKPGPWVRRVQVKDQFGALLGRDFLEIARAPAAPDQSPSTRVTIK
jgi:hypothetical protein